MPLRVIFPLYAHLHRDSYPHICMTNISYLPGIIFDLSIYNMLTMYKTWWYHSWFCQFLGHWSLKYLFVRYIFLFIWPKTGKKIDQSPRKMPMVYNYYYITPRNHFNFCKEIHLQFCLKNTPEITTKLFDRGSVIRFRFILH